jgi:hypothetical protein
MKRMHRLDPDAVDVESVTGFHLDDVRKPVVANDRSGPFRDHQLRRPGEQPQRRPVEMVVVQVRDEDRVHRREVDIRRWASAANRPEPRPEHRVGQDLLTAGLEKDGRVAEPGHPVHGEGGLARLADQIR